MLEKYIFLGNPMFYRFARHFDSLTGTYNNCDFMKCSLRVSQITHSQGSHNAAAGRASLHVRKEGFGFLRQDVVKISDISHDVHSSSENLRRVLYEEADVPVRHSQA